MPNQIFIKPRKPEFIVYKPNGVRLKSEGELVKADPFWQQRIKDKDVVVTTPIKTVPVSPVADLSTPKNKGK